MVVKNPVFTFPGNIYIPCMDLWLDPTRKRDFAFISHAHADHAARHKRIVATPATARLLEHRLGVQAHTVLEYGVSKETAGGKLTLYPAGHILGSAQILVEREDERLLYTGDFKLKPSPTTEPCEPVACDHLIMECTYGRPQYRFPDRKKVEAEFVDYVVASMKRGEVPVVLAYALGRSQEVIRLLTDAGLRVALERKVYDLSVVYGELGIDLGRFEEYDPDNLEDRVLIFPPHLWKAPVLQSIQRKRTIAVTGWAIDGRQNSWYRSDKAFPLSDHADFDDLIHYVEMTSPRNIYLIHGFPEFAEHLKRFDSNVYFLN